MNILSSLKRAGLALILFVAVYAPAFATVAWLHHRHFWCADKLGRLCPSIPLTIALIMAVSVAMALVFTAFLARGAKGFAEFGIKKPPASYVVAAALAGIVVGVGLAYLAARYPAPSPLDFSKLAPWMTFVFFILAAPIQEEFIFRGLLQTTIARGVSVPGSFWAAHFPVFFVAALFGVIHLGSGAVVVVGGVLLGLIAGELRRMSGSLAPAILVHALFNATSLWPTG